MAAAACSTVGPPSMPSPTRLAVRCLAAMGVIVLPVACRHTLPKTEDHSPTVIRLPSMPYQAKMVLLSSRLVSSGTTAQLLRASWVTMSTLEHAGCPVLRTHERLRSSAQGLGSFFVSRGGGIIV